MWRSHASGTEGGFVRGLWRKPTSQLREAAWQGERFVARLRVVLIGLIFVIPLVAYINTSVLENRIGLLVASFGLLQASLLVWALERRWFGEWIGFASGVMDATLVSIPLLFFLIHGLPAPAANSRVIYPLYIIAILATSLRFDARVCLVTGVAASAQYAAIVAVALWQVRTGRVAAGNYDYGTIELSDQLGRIVLLGATTVLAAVVVRRSGQLLLLATKDLLTGLSNRGFFEVRLQEEAERGKRRRQPIAIAMIDLDHFKAFNDAHGHRVGDEALRVLAKKLREAFRTGDTVARYGGEEFVVVMPASTGTEALERMERVREAVESLAVALPDRRSAGGLTVSVGVAAWPEDGATVDEVLIKADRRLYAAKQAGRNRVVGGEGPRAGAGEAAAQPASTPGAVRAVTPVTVGRPIG
jgi:diguanylate cyclase (GGDEF)-like protein